MNLWGRSQDSDRWTIFRQSNDGHNTLVIDGQLQRAAGHGDVVAFSDDPKFPRTVVDLSDVYQGQAESIRRGFALLPGGEVLIQDELTGLKPGSHVRWGMVTPGVPKEIGGASVRLVQDEASLELRILSTSGARWKTIDTAKPRNEWDSPNRGTRMVAFEAVAPQSGQLTLAVLATPGRCQKSLADTVELRALENW